MNTNIEDRAKQIIEDALKTLPRKEYNDILNHLPNDAFEKEPAYRIDFFYTNGGHTSSPVIFSSDNEAINAALREAQTRNVVCGGVCGIKVKKYTGEHDSSGLNILKTVYEKGETNRTIKMPQDNKIISYLEEHQSSTPSKWREKAEWRMKNKSWLCYSRHIAMMMLDKMEKLNINQEQLSKLLDCTQEHISEILKGQENLSLETMAKIEQCLKIQIFNINSD